jgi:hypothetical protein
MARIFAVAQGSRPIQAPHFAERPLKELLDLLKMSRSEKWSGSGPIIMQSSDDETGFVQIEVSGHEGEGLGWKDGWHLVRIPLSEAKNRLTLIHQ